MGGRGAASKNNSGGGSKGGLMGKGNGAKMLERLKKGETLTVRAYAKNRLGGDAISIRLENNKLHLKQVEGYSRQSSIRPLNPESDIKWFNKLWEVKL